MKLEGIKKLREKERFLASVFQHRWITSTRLTQSAICSYLILAEPSLPNAGVTLRLRPPGGSPIWLLRTTGALPWHRRALVLIGMCTTAMCSYSIHIGLVFIHKNSSLFICRHLALFPLAVDIPRVITLFGTPARPNPTPNPLLRQILPFLLCFVLFTRSIPSLCSCLVNELNFNYSSMNFYLENYNFQIFLLASFAHKILDNS